MRDLETVIRSLGNQSKLDLVRALEAEVLAAKRIAESNQRPRHGPTEEIRKAALAQVERAGRLLHFIQLRTPAQGSTREDYALYGLMERRLKDLGEWS
jgi:hypothetical protein